MARREVVNLQKCQVCHNDSTHDGITIPRLACTAPTGRKNFAMLFAIIPIRPISPIEHPALKCLWT